ncbi:oxidoreductase [Mesorhizobium sp. BR1-1-12]|uniref:oxidoreductase n=1 Tax=Mesorhizobium sp. BR1-1-12 TaxID=2876657 RepID=UPI001CD0B275|nr:oxidoreductase [Mesorhizobium sp. BR1-1-12]MBZ9973482.1 oxidoreductase [Mesorhizobium sp. BR1-1-12]
MPAIPTEAPGQSATVAAIYAAYEAANEPRDGRSISVSTLAEECERKLFYDFRWASPHESIPGRTLRIFETGNVEEERWIENLRMIGCEVWDRDDNGKQIMVEACGGHVRGYLDSEILGLPEAPKTIHVGEIKSHNAKSFARLLKDGVQKSKPAHYGQIQTYMYRRGRDRGIYLAVNKDTDELYAERVKLDVEFVIRLLARAQRIIDADTPPAKLHEDPAHKMAFACGWCKHKPICHEHAAPRVNCRTCLYSTPEEGGSWSCARFSKPLSADEQAAGCPAHLTLPGLVAGEQIDADEEAETVTYRMHDGTIWIDGASEQNAAA